MPGITEGLNGETMAMATGGQQMVTVSDLMGGYHQTVNAIGEQVAVAMRSSGITAAWEDAMNKFNQGMGPLVESANQMGTAVASSATLYDDAEQYARGQIQQSDIGRALGPGTTGTV